MFTYLNKNLILKSTNSKITPTITTSLFKLTSKQLHISKMKKKSVFDQTSFNPFHLDFQGRKRQKSTAEKFEDDNYKWESMTPPVKETGKELIQVIRSEELEKMKKMGLKKEPIGLGDKIEVEYYQSITSKKLHKYRGVVLSIKRRNSLNHSFKFLTMVAGSYVMLEYPYYSPMLHSVKVIMKDQSNKNRFRNHIYHIKQIKDFGWRLNEIMKGGKNVTITKSKTKELRKLENNKESIILE